MASLSKNHHSIHMADPNRPATGYPAPNPRGNGYSADPPSAGTAYPYAAAAPPTNPPYYHQTQAYYPQNYHPDPNPDAVRRDTFFRRIFAVVLGVIVILGTITFIIWLVLRPQLPEFRVDSFSLSNLMLANNSLASFTSQVRLTARNPNKKITLSYDRVMAEALYRSTSLSETTVTPFYQDPKTETSLTANFAAAGSFVDKSVVDLINVEIGTNGNVGYNLRIFSRIKFEAKVWRTRRRFLRVFCSDLKVSIPSNGSTGTLTGGPRKCRVDI